MKKWIVPMHKRINTKEIVRFLIGGGFAVITDYVLYYFLQIYLNISISKAL